MKHLLQRVIRQEAMFITDTTFTLSSGKESNVYFDLRRISLGGVNSVRLGYMMSDELKYIKKKEGWFDAIGGMELGAVPIVTAASIIYNFNNFPVYQFIVRKKQKDYGTNSKIEGPIRSGDNVVVVDDVLTTGNSIRCSIEECKKAGLNVVAALVVIDRYEDELDVGVPLYSCFTMTQLI